MIFECPHCSKKYNLPDDRLPKKKTASFTCTECKGIIKLDLLSKKIVTDNKQPLQNNCQPPANPAEQTELDQLKKSILKALKNLPPMPQVISKVREIMANPLSSFKDIANVIEKDQAIAAMILKTANSAYYGMSGKVSSIHQASVVLGYKSLSEILTVVGSAGLLGKRLKGYGMDSGDLWRHSLSVAVGSQIIVGMKNPSMENEAFSAGLLHDTGKLPLDKYIVEKKDAFRKLQTGTQQSLLNAEKQLFGFNHAETAFELCNIWNMPPFQANAIKYHHCPSASEGNYLAYVLHAADLIALMDSIGIEGVKDEIENGAISFLDITEEDLAGIYEKVKKAVDTIMESF